MQIVLKKIPSIPYMLDYMKNISKSISSEEMRIYLADDMPLKMSIELASTEGTSEFFVAPRISSE